MLRLCTLPPGTDRTNASGGGGGAVDVGRDQRRPRQVTGCGGVGDTPAGAASVQPGPR